jgi:hypothetical protein
MSKKITKRVHGEAIAARRAEREAKATGREHTIARAARDGMPRRKQAAVADPPAPDSAAATQEAARELCVFAFRLTEEERDAIHQAAARNGSTLAKQTSAATRAATASGSILPPPIWSGGQNRETPTAGLGRSHQPTCGRFKANSIAVWLDRHSPTVDLFPSTEGREPRARQVGTGQTGPTWVPGAGAAWVTSVGPHNGPPLRSRIAVLPAQLHRETIRCAKGC